MHTIPCNSGAASRLLVGALLATVSVAAVRAAEISGVIEELVVTAQRRSASVLDTSVSVSAFSSEALEARKVRDLRDLKTLVPGMQLGDSYGTAAITIRGIGTVEVLQGADPGVAYHIDGVYLGRSHLATAAFFDVGQVEILRGPQGTLFGRNSTGGTINFIPNEPTSEVSGAVKLGADVDTPGYQMEGVLSGPLVGDRLLGRLSVQRLYSKGFSDNLAPDGPGRLDDTDAYAIRGQLDYLVSDAFEIDLNVEHYAASGNGPAHYFVGTPSGAATVAEQLGGTLPDVDDRELHTNAGRSDLSYTGGILKIIWEAPVGTLTSATSYYESDSRFANDFDGTEVDFTTTDIDNASEQFFQELLYTAPLGDRLDVVLGANFFKEQSDQTVLVPIHYPGQSLTVLIASEIDTESYAGFAHLTYQVAPRWELSGGLRFTSDDKSARRSNNFVGSGDDHASWDEVTYEAGVAWLVGENTRVYGKFSKGYKGGGFESSGPLVPPFDPELNDTLELGLKGQYFGSRVQLMLAAFTSDYTDLQVNQIVGVSNTVTNAADAQINGFEVEMVALPLPALTLELSYSYLDASFEEFVTVDSARPGLGLLDLAGNRLRNSPKHTVSSGVYYALPLGRLGELTLGARYYWQDKMYFSEFNLPISSQDDVGRVDLSLDLVTPDGAWEAALFATNVTDETVFNDVVVVSDLLSSAAFAKLDAGRRVSLTVRRNF